jgi:hypothetical protein
MHRSLFGKQTHLFEWAFDIDDPVALGTGLYGELLWALPQQWLFVVDMSSGLGMRAVIGVVWRSIYSSRPIQFSSQAEHIYS